MSYDLKIEQLWKWFQLRFDWNESDNESVIYWEWKLTQINLDNLRECIIPSWKFSNTSITDESIYP